MRRSVFTIFAVLLLGSPAGANPVTDRVLRVQQVPHTQHVQVSYAVESFVTPTTPTTLHRNSTVLSPTWTTFSGFSTNTGSGLTDLSASQWCDCNVPLGFYTYSAASQGGGTLQGEVTVVADLEYPADAGVVAPDAEPWDIPEPVGIQGLDCSQACSTGTPDAGVPDAGAPDAGSDPDDKDGGGCSLAGSATGITLVGLWVGLSLMLMIVVAIRRRRR